MTRLVSAHASASRRPPTPLPGGEVDARVAALQDALKDLAAELRLVDVADYIAFIRYEQFANIQDIVNSSVELIFRPGALSFGWAASYELDWASAPKISLGMEFRRLAVRVVFKLALTADRSDVSIEHFSSAEGESAAEFGVRCGKRNAPYD